MPSGGRGYKSGKEKKSIKSTWSRDFPGGPEVKNPFSNVGETGLITGEGIKIPHAMQQLSPSREGCVCNEDPVLHHPKVHYQVSDCCDHYEKVRSSVTCIEPTSENRPKVGVSLCLSVGHWSQRRSLKRWEYQITFLVSWKTCIQVKKKQSESDMEQQTGSKLGREYVNTVYCPLFNLYAEYIMWKAGLNESQAGIKIAGRNINNLR